jgi:cellulose synthase/poly-beta-1,6-N-acetylglucosamine synthase-like glycosyltransferase
MEPFLVSVTVCVRDGYDWISGCLEALRLQTYPAIEILVVNDGSSDDAESILDQWNDPEGLNGHPIRVHNQGQLGLAAGRQWALKHAKGEWVAITDIDVRPEQDWISNLVAEIQPVSDDERVVAVTGRTVFERADDLVSRFRSVEIASKYRSRPRRTSLANGPCSMFHRTSLLEVGGFDPEWYHAEDMEVSLRLIEAGGTIVYAPEALVRHVPETGITRFLNKRKRDARAHVRIVRHYPKGKRAGPGFDFLGSSAMVLILFPLWLAIFISGLPFLYEIYRLGTLDWEQLSVLWETKVLIGSFILLFLHEIILWRGPLGVVNRTVLRSAKGSKIKAMFGVRRLTILWSIALWHGLILGCLDAVSGKHGHKPLLRTKKN